MRGFKYQITMSVKQCKQKMSGDKEYANVYFNSITKIVINYDFEHLIDRSFEEILYRLIIGLMKGRGG